MSEPEPTPPLTVREAIHQLMDMPPQATLMICAHAWPGQEGRGWHVTGLEVTTGDKHVLVEGAGPIEEGP